MKNRELHPSYVEEKVDPGSNVNVERSGGEEKEEEEEDHGKSTMK